MIALIDMDNYFASVEIARNPFLISKPVAVIGLGKKTVVTSANYLAKMFGVKIGTTPQEAIKLCPNIVLVKADFGEYERTSLRIYEIINKYFPIIKEASVDEFYVDCLAIENYIERLKDVKNDIREEIGITCSIGVGPNPLIAKMASEVEKPDGFVVVNDVEEFLKTRSVSDIPGIGKVGKEMLSKIVENAYEFSQLSDSALLRYGGNSLLALSRGLTTNSYNRKVFFSIEPPKSIGHSITLDKPVKSFNELFDILEYLFYCAYIRMVRGELKTKGLSLYLKDFLGNSLSISKSLSIHNDDYYLLQKVLKELLKKLYSGNKIVKIGVSLINLKKLDFDQIGLFWENEKMKKIAQISDVKPASFWTLGNYKILEKNAIEK